MQPILHEYRALDEVKENADRFDIAERGRQFRRNQRQLNSFLG